MITNKPNNKKGTLNILNHAKKLFKMAIEEFKEAENGNWDKIMDSAEKAWGTTSNACEVILRTGVNLLKRKLGDNFSTIRNLWIYDNGAKNPYKMSSDKSKLRFLMENNEEIEMIYYIIYVDNKDELHGRCFYNGYTEEKLFLKKQINESTKKFLDFSEEFFLKNFV